MVEPFGEDGGQGIFLSIPRSAANGLKPAVRTRRCCIELLQDGHAPLGSYQRRIDAPQQPIIAQPARSHRREAFHQVAPVQVEQPTYGSHAVCRISIGSVRRNAAKHPSVSMIGSLALVFKEIVNISSLHMRQLAEQPLAVHLECGKGKVVVTAVFRHETMTPRALRRVHQSPALFKRSGSRHLHRHMLPRFHRRTSHLGVCLPGRTDINKVNIATTYSIPPPFLPAQELRTWPAAALHQRSRLVKMLCADVGQHTYFRSAYHIVARQRLHTTLPHTNKRDAHHRNALSTVKYHGFKRSSHRRFSGFHVQK